ncbi:MAG TPA: DUF3093 domain-containing protein [Galbitalea sp.]|jgi:hypothetical protein|nr:DUF3093 domain-containing protein [Galbitalea sp.]
MSLYSERLLPGPWIFVITALIIPASLLVFLPINFTVGVVCAAVLYSACVILLVISSPRIEVTDAALVAGRARIPLINVGDASGYTGAEATAERGVRLDARAWLVIRGWISPVVKVAVNDADDPTPYWLVSTRHPRDLVAALNKAQHDDRAIAPK